MLLPQWQMKALENEWNKSLSLIKILPFHYICLEFIACWRAIQKLMASLKVFKYNLKLSIDSEYQGTKNLFPKARETQIVQYFVLKAWVGINKATQRAMIKPHTSSTRTGYWASHQADRRNGRFSCSVTWLYPKDFGWSQMTVSNDCL